MSCSHPEMLKAQVNGAFGFCLFSLAFIVHYSVDFIASAPTTAAAPVLHSCTWINSSLLRSGVPPGWLTQENELTGFGPGLSESDRFQLQADVKLSCELIPQSVMTNFQNLSSLCDILHVAFRADASIPDFLSAFPFPTEGQTCEFEHSVQLQHLIGGWFVDRAYDQYGHEFDALSLVHEVAIAEIEPPFSSQNALHAVVWQTALKFSALSPQYLWKKVSTSICNFGMSSEGYLFDCIHAVGHGVLLAAFLRDRGMDPISYSACLPVRWSSAGITMPQVRDALRACSAANKRQFVMYCASGVYHHFFEAGMDPPAIITLEQGMHMCANEAEDMTLWCFQLLLSNGAVGGFFPSRLLLGDYLTMNCTEVNMRSEASRLGCIAAMTMNGFRTYHDRISSILHELLQGFPGPACAERLMLTWGSAPDVSGYAPLRAIASSIIFSNSNVPILARWCDRFAPIKLLNSMLVRKRFQCCVAASGTFFVKKAFIEKFDPARVRVHCDDLARPGWTPDVQFRHQIRDECVQASIIRPGFTDDERVPLEQHCLP